MSRLGTGQTLSVGMEGRSARERRLPLCGDQPIEALRGGSGVQFSAGRLRFSPELRYTHWNRQVIQGGFGNGPGYGSTQIK